MVFVARMQRLRGSGASILRAASLPNIKRKASNSWSAVQDTYLSTKDVFERHRVVFTTATSLGSILTAWAGYSLRHHHQSKIEERLHSIEESVKTKNKIEHQEIKKIVTTGNVSTTVYLATAWTCLVIGYSLGWRGGSWYANRKFRREQLKLMGQIKPKKWRFMKVPLIRSRILGVLQKPIETASL